jgi:CDP-diacylglycerol---glycerol-3-phosphate 3-phosphatidyltransferase
VSTETTPPPTPVAPPSTKPARVLRYKPDKRLTPANGVTVGRIVITPVVLMLLARRQFDWPTFLLGFIACGSDLIDGMLARRDGATSAGAFLDPLADKFLVLGAMFVLAWKHALWWPLVIIVAVREVWIQVYRSRLAKRSISLPARKLAKWKTLVQQLAIGFAALPYVGREWPWVAHTAMVAATILTVWSGVLYFMDARHGTSGIPSSQRA